jgi:hypothetical protein
VVFTREDAARAAQTIGIDFKKEAFQLEDLLNGMNTELARHGTKQERSMLHTMTPQ